MPTLRVLSGDIFYNTLDAKDRKAISTALKQAGADVLGEDISGVEGIWYAPFEWESADNPLPYSVDVQFSMNIDDAVYQALEDRVLASFDGNPKIPEGTQVGVWITTPFTYRWRQRATK